MLTHWSYVFLELTHRNITPASYQLHWSVRFAPSEPCTPHVNNGPLVWHTSIISAPLKCEVCPLRAMYTSCQQWSSCMTYQHHISPIEVWGLQPQSQVHLMSTMVLLYDIPASYQPHCLHCQHSSWDESLYGSLQSHHSKHPRQRHSPSLLAIGLSSVGYETWPPIGWHHPFVIDWSEYRLGLPSAPLHYGLMWPVGIPTIFQIPVTVSLHCPNVMQCLTLGLCKGTVKESSKHPHNKLRPEQNGKHIADDIFKHIFLNENLRIFIQISLKFVLPEHLIDSMSSLVKVMAWRHVTQYNDAIWQYKARNRKTFQWNLFHFPKIVIFFYFFLQNVYHFLLDTNGLVHHLVFLHAVKSLI